MATNVAKFEEGTEIVIDSRTEAANAGWTLGHVSVLRVGSLVALHIEATNAVSAAAPICTLPTEFRPPDTITDPSGNFTITSAGVVSFTGSTAAGALRVCQAIFVAAQASP